MRKLAPVALAAGILLGAVLAPRESLAHPVGPRLLVLSAFPAELDALLVHASIAKTVVIDGRSFYVGRLAGNDVLLAMTGIGLVNAEKATRDALGRFAIKGIVFSGVAGSQHRIGDVAVPRRWTEDEGATWIAVDPTMLSVAESATASSPPALERCAPLGDLACVGLPANVSTGICVSGAPQVFFGGDGKSSDPFAGRALPCIPLGGDVFGCNACRAPRRSLPDLVRFVSGITPFLDPGLIQDFIDWQASSATGAFDAADMETAAVARVARELGLPFLGFRGASDGAGDPLMLPGFPVQFFVYRQLAADNAAAAAITFLEAWSVH